MADQRLLLVLRHAKSSWEDPELEDHERPLAPRGRQAAKLLRRWLRAQAIHPAVVLCSTALRARQTLELVDPDGERIFEPGLYDASGAHLIERLRDVPDGVDSVMLVGHNPAVHDAVLALSDAPPSDVNQGAETGGTASSDLAHLKRKFPTGALALLTLSCRWSELGPHCAELVRLIRPKHLEQR
ncbi:MAG: histidine phosphatase family protein [Solirubrobacterales bacterium]|nr:histidine phosphatase family protein [Solirubrobacterales bacterium]MBV9916171.1 histidine phosphatase family protein [Solirubrobacterales bacterium]